MKGLNSYPFYIESTVKLLRKFFDDLMFHEVITPVLFKAIPAEPTLYAFSTEWGNEKFYLPTSPEAYLKKVLATGAGNCYSIAHTFRNLEATGNLHSPEFLMLEWYRENSTYTDIMRDITNLLKFLVEHTPSCKLKLAGDNDIKKIRMSSLFKEYLGVTSIEDYTDNELKSLAESKNINTEGLPTWEQLFNQLFLNFIEPNLPTEPFFLVDFPAKISPLCKPSLTNPNIAERFELYINRIELANGCTEPTDYKFLQKVFEDEIQYRELNNLPKAPIDYEFVKAVKIAKEKGLNLAGVGMGVERVSMLLNGKNSIRDLKVKPS